MKRDLIELNNWFDNLHKEAYSGLKKLDFNLYMEVKIYPEKLLNRENKELRDVARKSTIHTFGWPIAVFLDTKDEYSPKPKQYGIKAEISIKDSEDLIDKRYDYWAIKKDGSFYLLKSLFENSRKPGYLFFNTRIIRTTEVLMYALNLYSKLGLNENERVIIEIKYSGLKNLTMTTVGNRLITGEYKNNSENEISSPKIKPTMKEIDEKMSDFVEILVKPLFEIFDWFEIKKNIIDEIVFNYRHGKVT